MPAPMIRMLSPFTRLIQASKSASIRIALISPAPDWLEENYGLAPQYVKMLVWMEVHKRCL